MRWSFESDDAVAAYRARGDLVAYLTSRATAESDVAAAELIFGELVGNVVQHAPGPISVEVAWQDGVAVLRVRDLGPGFDVRITPRSPDPYAESGRGLFIVYALAQSLALERLPGAGIQATARLPIWRKTS